MRVVVADDVMLTRQGIVRLLSDAGVDVVAEAEDAERRGASWVALRLDGRVELTIEDDGAPRATPLVHVADRIGALGGSTSFGERTLHAEVPCA